MWWSCTKIQSSIYSYRIVKTRTSSSIPLLLIIPLGGWMPLVGLNENVPKADKLAGGCESHDLLCHSLLSADICVVNALLSEFCGPPVVNVNKGVLLTLLWNTLGKLFGWLAVLSAKVWTGLLIFNDTTGADVFKGYLESFVCTLTPHHDKICIQYKLNLSTVLNCLSPRTISIFKLLQCRLRKWQFLIGYSFLLVNSLMNTSQTNQHWEVKIGKQHQKALALKTSAPPPAPGSY